MPHNPQPWLKRVEAFLGLGMLRLQLLLLGIAVSVYAILWLLQSDPRFVGVLVYTLTAGNVVTLLMALADPLYNQPFPRDWIVYLALLVPVATLASLLGGIPVTVAYRIPAPLRVHWLLVNTPFGALISFITGTGIYGFVSVRRRLQAANLLLAEQVHHGRQELESHVAELRAAFEIQSNLLPRTIPQIAGVEISCAWQPARTVSGDFFDVLVLSDTRIAFCLADVSGKGMSAALITANLQATFRAFAPAEPSPANLCRRLNKALCASLPQGRFVTLFYGILDRSHMTLVYELAGHGPPTLLRRAEAVPLAGTGPVLGLLPDAGFTDHTVRLEPGDRIILTTDGVTEAFNAAGDEFGEDRVIAAARRPGLATAHHIRSAILAEVTRFADGSFHDDASLMVVQLSR